MARGQPLPPAREKSRVPLLLKRPASPDAPGASFRHLLLNRWPGRLLIGTVVLKVVLWIAEALVGTNAAIDWLKQLGNPYSVVAVDSDGRTAIDFGVYGAPETFFIDADGRVQYRHVGPMTDEVWQREFMSRIPRGALP